MTATPLRPRTGEDGTTPGRCSTSAPGDPSPGPDGDDLRAFMAGFPTGVAVVTSCAEDGEPHGMTCTSLTSVSAEPPLVLVCLDHRSGTLRAVRSSQAFAVNLLHDEAQPAAQLFASAEAHRFARVDWQPSAVLGAPWLVQDAFARIECRVEVVQPAGDHDIVVGRLVGVQQRAADPLIYGLRRFGSWSGAGTTDHAAR